MAEDRGAFKTNQADLRLISVFCDSRRNRVVDAACPEKIRVTDDDGARDSQF
jgi:hypothetical protein